MTGNDIAVGARDHILLDIDTAARRWTDTQVVWAINRALADIFRLKPECFWVTSEVTTCPQIVTLAETIAIGGLYENALIDLTVHWMLKKDAADKFILERSLFHLKAGIESLKS